MFRQREWRLQNEPITKSGVLPITTYSERLLKVLCTFNLRPVSTGNDTNKHSNSVAVA